MSWSSAIRKQVQTAVAAPVVPLAQVDFDRLVTVDFETYFDQDYTLSKLSTSEYVRDPRFKAQMVGIKVGNKPTKVYTGDLRIRTALLSINWATHSVLCHNTQFDGFILSHHYNIKPARYYDTLSMARGLHSNEIGAGLDEVAKFYGGEGKIEGALEATKGVRDWPKKLIDSVTPYCARDIDECFRIFQLMAAKYPADEMDIIDLTCRMFCDPVLKVDIPRVQKELERELSYREKLFFDAVDPADYADAKLLKGKEKLLPQHQADTLIIKRVIGSNERFAELLRAEGVEPPVKISPAWIKKSADEKLADPDGKWIYAFGKDDHKFTSLPDQVEMLGAGLNLNKKSDVALLAARQDRVRTLVECRLAVKSVTNVTRAQRFLTAGANGMPLPCGYAYYRAHTGRMGGNNKMNMQNLTRGGELRLSILAPKGHKICVADSGQIEARVNAWLWGQRDLLDAFRDADAGRGRDAYCLFADNIYNRTITKADPIERFVGKTCVLGLGFQMGAAKLQITLAKGTGGAPKVYLELDECQKIISLYRQKNDRISNGWKICDRIIRDMANGVAGSHGPISWAANTIWLPNGMSLKYPDLRLAENDNGWAEWSYQAGDKRSKLYGGLLCENIVQALARIIVFWQMLQISRKYRIVMTTHDETVTLPKASAAAACFAYMEKWMRTAPPWCADIPLNVEGGYADNYSK